MKKTHNGKIGRLSLAVREQLNERLRKGEKGRALVDWLNALPEVQSVLAAEFGGKPIREQNLSEWRKRGHRQWLSEEDAMVMMKRIFADGHQLIGAANGAPADKMAAWVTARYLASARTLTRGAGEDATAWKRLRELCHDVVALRRGELQAERLEFETVRAARTIGNWQYELAGETPALPVGHPVPQQDSGGRLHPT